MKPETALGAALKSAVSGMSKRKQTELVAQHIYGRYNIFRQYKPLAIGIEEKLCQDMSQYDPQIIRRVLANHCRRLRYLNALAKGGRRFDLNGRPKGEISPEEQQAAQTFLDNKKAAEKTDADNNAAATGHTVPAPQTDGTTEAGT